MKHGLIWTVGALLIWAAAGSGRADEVLLEPSIAVRQEYNDNIFFDYDQAQDDYITTVLLGIDFLNRTERRQLKLKGTVEPFFYKKNNELDDTNVNLLADLNYLLSPRLKTSLDGSYRIDNRPDRDIDVSGLVFGSDERYQYHAGATVELALHEVNSVALSYAYDQDDWNEGMDSAERQDFEGHNMNLEYRHDLTRWFEATQLLLGIGFGRYDYDTAEISSSFAVLGIERMLSEIFRIKASAGSRYTDSEYTIQRLVVVPPGFLVPREETVDSENWGGIGSLGLDYLGERASWTVSLYHDLRTSGGSEGASNLTRLTFNLRYRMLEDFSLGFFTGYYINKADADEYQAEGQEEKTFTIRPFMRWQFWERFTLEGAYQYNNLENDIIADTAERHTVYLQLRFGYDLMD